MRIRRFPLLSLLALVAVAPAQAQSVADLEQIRQRAVIRVLVVPSQTNYFISNGEPRGLLHDLLSEYGRALGREITVEFVCVARDELIPALLAGQGDIAAGVAVAAEVPAGAIFTEPYLAGINEIVVCSKSARDLTAVADLSDHRVDVVRGGAPAKHLSELSDELQRRGQKPIRIVEARESLAAEDLLEMVNAGLIEMTVVDEPTAAIWGDVLPNLQLRRDLIIHRDDQNAFAVRSTNPKLLESANAFVRSHRKGTLAGNELFRRYFAETKWLANPLSDDPLGSLRTLEAPLRKYATMYGFDWLFLAAQGFQESRLSQNARSAAGAVGVMQLEPATARGLGFANVEADVDENIHAGAKYMAELRSKWFSDGTIAPEDQLHFTLAAYNAGPGNVKRWREIARERRLNPDKWLGSVERISLEQAGEQTYRYVRNIDSYFVAYTEWQRIQSERQADVR